MRRTCTLAAFLLVISLVPLCAQRGGRSSGGGRAVSGGSHGGFSGHSGFAGHPAGFGGSHFSSLSGSRVSSGPRFSSRNRFRGSRFVNRRFGSRCLGCLAYGYPYYGFYDPYWGWGSSASAYDEDDAQDREQAAEMNQENLQEQQMLRRQEQDQYARPANRPPAAETRDEQAQLDPATVLVFRDRHQREIQNYAIVDEMLWVFTPRRIEKIPLAALDVPATIKVNGDHGVDFRLPESSPEQPESSPGQ